MKINDEAEDWSIAAKTDGRAVVSRIGDELTHILGSITAEAVGQPYALLDFPDHSNVGDSAIWAGERILLEELLDARPAFVAAYRVDWEKLEQRCSNGPIFLHGGGNFGDIWPYFQQFREKVLTRYSGRPVVQLPQSIHFGDEGAAERCARVIADHGNFTLLVRDRQSLAFAQERFACKTLLCPDSAFAMGPQQRRVAPDLDVLLLLRTDKEKVVEAAEARWPNNWWQTDWLNDDPDLYSNVLRQVRREALFGFSLAKMSRRARELRYFDELASRRIERGLRLLSRARVIITDRLHVHILSTLLGIPHICLDNSYGKIRRLSTAVGTAWNGVRFVDTLVQAEEAARDILDQVGSNSVASPDLLRGQ